MNTDSAARKVVNLNFQNVGGLVVTMCNTYRVTKAHSKLCTLVRGGKR